VKTNFLLIGILFLSVTSVARPSIAQESAEIVGFKGINLGMTKDEFKKVFLSDENFMPRGKFDGTKDNVVADLGRRKFCQFKTQYIIGKEGTGETSTSFRIAQMTVNFFEDKIYEIEIEGPNFDANGIGAVKYWAKFALQGLKKKYGECKTLKPVDNATILDFEHHNLNIWTTKGSLICLTLMRSESYFYSAITFTDTNAAIKIQENKSNTSSEF
jgi:hypothetical protein